MKFPTLLAMATAAAASPVENEKRASGVQGFDVSHHQSSVDFDAAYSGGLRFAYVKATEGTTFRDPAFSNYYTASYNAGMIRGAYHFAGTGDPVAEAQYFLAHGGKWSADGMTLPGMLDLEADCKSASWIQSFSDYYQSQTGRYPVLYSSPSWWKECTGNSNAFANTNPLMLARYNSVAGTPQGGWPYYTIWQYNNHSSYGGDSDVFNGSIDQLRKLATG